MYLSRVEIDKNNRRKIKDLTHLGAYHNWVEQSFPWEIESGDRSRKLWRVDTLGDKEYLLVVSEKAPYLKKLERYGVEETAKTTDYSDYIERLEEGMELRFRIKLNPVMSKKVEGKSRGRVVPLVSDADQLEYLLSRAEDNGFSLDNHSYQIVSKGYERYKQKGKKTINIVKAEYEGTLTITDIDKFKNLLLSGMGKKKAYGFGMMTVIPTGQ